MKTFWSFKASVIVTTFVASLLIVFMVIVGLSGRTLARAAVTDRNATGTVENLDVSTQDHHILIDHSAVDADAIPQAWLDGARGLDTFFAHMSVGNNILDGMADLQTQNPGRYAIAVHYGGASWFGPNDGILHRTNGINNYPQTKIDGFDDYIRNGGFHVADVAMMKLCPADVPPFASMSAADTWAAYRDMMEALEGDYPDVTFVWWTMPLSTADDNRGNDEHAVFNDAVRSHCAINGCVLFDIADIESHDPSGNAVVGPTGHEAMYSGYSSDGAHLNETGGQRVAQAMWWLLARAAGWQGTEWVSVTAAANVASIHPGETAIYTLSLTAGEGVTLPVSLDLQGVPLDTIDSFDPNPVTPPGDSQLYITSTASTVVGTYAMTVTGTSGALTDTANLALVVASAAPSFTLNVSPTMHIAQPNQGVSCTVALTGVSGFSQPVTLTVLGLPAAVGEAWSSNPVIPDDLSVLTLSVPSRPSFGDYLLMIVGTSETQVVAESIELTIDYPYKGYLPIVLK